MTNPNPKRFLAIDLDFDGPDVQEVHAFATPEERVAYFRTRAKEYKDQQRQASTRAIVWEMSGYRSALIAVNIPEEPEQPLEQGKEQEQEKQEG